MGSSTGEIQQQIAETRGDMEAKILRLREESRRTVRRTARVALIAAGVGVGIGAGVVAAVIIYRMTRPPTMRERVSRVVPNRWWQRAMDLRDRFELGLRRQVPPVRLYVGHKQVGEEPPASRLESLVVKAAQAAGTATAAAIVSRLFSRASGREAA